MDTSRRLVLAVLVLVLAKTIDPTLPLKLRYYTMIMLYYVSQMVHYTRKHHQHFRAILVSLPRTVLVALADRLGTRKSPKFINNLLFHWMARDHRDDSTVALLREVLVELRRRAVQRMPDMVHHLSDRVTMLHEHLLAPALYHYKQIPHHDYLSTALLTSLTIFTIRRCFKRVRNAAEVPLEWYTKQTRLRGWCVAVTDSDNIRFYHAPTIFHGPGAQEMKSRRLETINVRLAGIDAPEVPSIL